MVAHDGVSQHGACFILFLSPQVHLGSMTALLSKPDPSPAASPEGQIPAAFVSASPASGPDGQSSCRMPGIVVGGYNLRSRRLRQEDHGFEASLVFPALPFHFGPGSSTCSPGLESTYTSLHPGQETEALPGDTGSEATVQSEQGL